MKELKDLIATANDLIKTCERHGWNMDDEKAVVSAAEAALKRAKVFEGVFCVDSDGPYVHDDKGKNHDLYGFKDKDVTIIIIPKEADDAGK